AREAAGVMNDRRMPSGALLLVFGVCIGLAAARWYAGAREFDIGFRNLFSSRKEAVKAHTPPPPPPPPRPEPQREAALQAQQEAALRAEREAAAALQEARAAVVEAREASGSWNSEVVPLLKNYDGHLIAANPDLVQRFRMLYHSGPSARVLSDLEVRLATFN